MEREKIFESIEEYIKTLKDLFIDKIAFCETNERRVTQKEGNLLEVVPVVKVELLAYRDSVLYKCSVNEIDLNETYRRLESEGFNLTRSSRNIT